MVSWIKSLVERLSDSWNDREKTTYHLGEGMLVNHTEDGGLVLKNTLVQREIQVLDRHKQLKNILPGDIDYERIDRLENPQNAYSLSAPYGFGIEQFRNGVALVWWTLYPDGRYFEDEDGFGGENCNETTVYAYIDTLGRIVIPFRDMTYEERQQLRMEAERKTAQDRNK